MSYQGALTYDEYGRPFIIIREQKGKKVLSGNEVIFSNIAATKAITSIMKSSLGPKGLDKMITDELGDVIVTNDGATMLQEMDVEHEIAKLLVDIAKSQDQEIGDGTTGVVVLAGALMEQAEQLMQRGIHPIRITDGFELAAQYCLKHLEKISEPFPVDTNNVVPMIQVANTALGSKIVSKCHEKMASIAVGAVMHIANLKEKQVDINWIKIETVLGGTLDDTILVEGVAIQENFSHSQMPKELQNVKIAILSCSFEPPDAQTKATIEVKSKDTFDEVQSYEDNLFKEMVEKVKDTGAKLVICPSRIDDKANSILLQNHLVAIPWVTAKEMELISSATGARIVPRIEHLTPEKLGFAGSVKEINFGTNRTSMILIEKCKNSNNATILIRGGSHVIVDEAKRSIHDALCAVRNLIIDNRIVYGGGASEVSCAVAVSVEADKVLSLEQYSFRAFAEALESIPIALAENSGYHPYNVLTQLKSDQIASGRAIYGVDCMGVGTNDMKFQGIIDTLQGKKQQITLATNVVKMILRIDEVRLPNKKE